MISVVLPAFNESSMLKSTVSTIHDLLIKRNEDFEIIIVENGSTDDTGEIAKKLVKTLDHVKSFHESEANYGRALKRGFNESTGDIVINFDVDFYDFDFLERAVAKIRETKQNRPSIIVGSKRNVDSNDERPFLRKLATNVFSKALKVLFGLKVSDTHGIKAIHRSSVEPIVNECVFEQDLFDTELILKSERAKLVVSEIAVNVKEERPARSKLLSRIPRTLKGLFILRLNLLRESTFRRKSA